MRKLTGALAVMLVVAVLAAGPARAAPADDTATCSVTATVNDIMEWEANFPAVDLGALATQAGTLSGSASVVLYTNGDVDISADNMATAQLSETGGDVLVTEFQLSYDGDGTTTSGGTTVTWTAYDSFLTTASRLTHVDGDGACNVTLEVRASNAAGTLAESGSYSCTQTLTASWAGV